MVLLALLFALSTQLFGSEKKQPIQTPELSCEIKTTPHAYSKTPVLGLAIGSTHFLQSIATLIAYDLEFTDQMTVDMKKTKEIPSDEQLQKTTAKTGALCLVIRECSGSTEKQLNLDVSIKEAATGQEHFSKKFICRDASKVFDAHTISDELMIALTGEKGPALSTLAYCKQISTNHKVVCIADYAAKIEKTLTPTKTINVAPAWHSQEPGLCYSQFTKVNGRLMYVDLKGKKHKVICSFDGLNMQPSFSPDGSKVALCLSGKGNSEIYLYDQRVSSKLKKRVYQPLTNNGGNNTSPCLLPNNDLIFCSDFQTGNPQVYIRDGKSEFVRRLTNGRGYCAAPSYSIRRNDIVYTRFIGGTFQLFIMDLSQDIPVERQLTKSKGDKLDPAWSECGRFIAYTLSEHDKKTGKKTNQIAILNLMSGKQRVITTSNEHKSFPCWTSRCLYTL